jgi:hypothetical protein
VKIFAIRDSLRTDIFNAPRIAVAEIVKKRTNEKNALRLA